MGGSFAPGNEGHLMWAYKENKLVNLETGARIIISGADGNSNVIVSGAAHIDSILFSAPTREQAERFVEQLGKALKALDLRATPDLNHGLRTL
jgi:hypothetical protein